MTGIQKVLIVDDDADIRDLLIVDLEMSGYQVLTAENGVEAEELAKQELPDLIVLDVMMPGRTGYEVLTSLRADDRTNEIPVVMLTALTNDEDVWAGWAAGADYYMTKPFDYGELERFIKYLEQPGGEDGERPTLD
jgi:DNA-binding response OmpR family regulator